MTAVDVDVADLTGLDFQPTLPCEHSGHARFHVRGDPAAWIVTVVCPACGDAERYLLCDSGRRLHALPSFSVGCACGFVDTWGAFVVSLDPIGGVR